jgi:dephospho-CoA kinase
VRTLRIGLTGGLASGKSTVLAELARLGADTMCADDTAHELLKEKAFSARVARRFGRDVLAASGGVDRKALGAKVFGRPGELKALERILHPEIRRRMNSRMAASKKPVAVADVPLLFEKGLEAHYDLTVAVTAPESVRAARLKKRDGMAPAAARRRMRLLWPDERKAAKADVVIDNGRPWAKVKPELRGYYEGFELLARGAHAARKGTKGR